MQLLLDAELPLDLQKGNRFHSYFPRVIRRGSRTGVRIQHLGATPSSTSNEKEDSGYDGQSAEDGGDGAAGDRGCVVVSSDIRGVICIHARRSGWVRRRCEVVEGVESVGWSRGY